MIFGTGNLAKLGSMQRRLADLPVEIVGLNEAKEWIAASEWEAIQDVKEDGTTLLENAVIKARSYYRVFRRPVFSCDSGLYFENENFPEELQPGVHVRTIHGKYCSDEEVTEYYAALAKQYGELRARYRHAICLILDGDQEFSAMDESLASRPFLITDVPHERPCKPGFPLDRLSKDLETGIYLYDLGDEELVDRMAVEKGMTVFFRDILKSRGYL